MNCPHCGNEIEQPAGTMTLNPAKIKNLSITAWCPLCKKPKAYAGTLIFGDSDEEGVQTVPEMCMCSFYQPAPHWIPNVVNAAQAGTIEIKL